MIKSKALPLIFGILITAIALGLITVWLRFSPQDLTLRFHPYIGDKPLVLNSQSYKNPGGNGEFSIRDFQLFISNIVVDYPVLSIAESESYHLLRFDGITSFDQIVIPEIKIQNLKKLSFGVGIEPKANGTIIISGDLDPNGRMAWNWQVGYKFLLLEGMLTVQNEQRPLVYHIGFDESYTELNFHISKEEVSNDGVINFKIDLLRLFQQLSTHNEKLTKHRLNESMIYIDMSEMPHVKFAPADVRIIANGFKHFISIL